MNSKAIITLLVILKVSLSAFSQTDETAGDRKYYDSAHFYIIVGKYITGEKYLEWYGNKLNKLDSWKLFYKNGQLKEQGVMTNPSHIYVGIWKYYSPAGKLDSVINYDKKTPISYFMAVNIAETKGYKMPDMEVSETTYNNKSYWQVARWKENPAKNGAMAETILIDKRRGEVVKPNFTLTATY